jgi:hypothetical protein
MWNEQVASAERLIDTLHLTRHLAEPHHVWPHCGFATICAVCFDGEVLVPGRACSASGAECALELAMHVNEPPGAGGLMQRVDVLGDGQDIAMLPLKHRQRQMGSIRLCSFVPATAEIVEVMDADRIAREGFRRRHVLDPEVFPEPARATKCAEPAFGGEPCAGQDDNVVKGGHVWVM